MKAEREREHLVDRRCLCPTSCWSHHGPPPVLCTPGTQAASCALACRCTQELICCAAQEAAFQHEQQADPAADVVQHRCLHAAIQSQLTAASSSRCRRSNCCCGWLALAAGCWCCICSCRVCTARCKLSLCRCCCSLPACGSRIRMAFRCQGAVLIAAITLLGRRIVNQLMGGPGVGSG